MIPLRQSGREGYALYVKNRSVQVVFFDTLDPFVSSQVHRVDGEFVDAVVDRVVSVAFDFDPRDLVPRGLFQEVFPQIFVFDRLF